MLHLLSVTSAVVTIVLSTVMIVVFSRLKKNLPSMPPLLALLVVGVLYQIVVFSRVSGHLNPSSLGYESQYPLYLGSISLVYIYISSFTEKVFKFSNVSLWHVLPFILGWGWCFAHHFWVPSPLSEEFTTERYLRACLTLAIALPYLLLAQRKVSLLTLEAKETHSSLLELKLPWLRFLLNLWLLSLLAGALVIATGVKVPLWAIASSMYTLGILGLTFYGLLFSQLFTEELRSTAQFKLSPEDLERQTEKLLNFLKTERPYLNPQIHLSDLAADLGIKNYLLSEVINRGLKTNFYDLINGLRIEEAKNKLQDPAYSHLNLHGIALDSGFNSKSSFNEGFRRMTGMTPSAFRGLHLTG